MHNRLIITNIHIRRYSDLKKFILGLVCGIGLTATTAVYASETIQAYLFPVRYEINGQDKELDSEYVTLNYNGYAYVPVRFIAESMGASVGYHQQSSTIFIDQPSDVPYSSRNLALGIPNLEGYITKVENQRILVVSSNPKDFSSTGGVKEFYDAVWVTNVPKDVKVGQQVQVWFQGGVALTSYPGQARSDKISFKTIEKPIKATLSEEQIINQAVNEYVNIKIFVIKEVKYDEVTDKWQIRFKDGILDTSQGRDYIVQITD